MCRETLKSLVRDNQTLRIDVNLLCDSAALYLHSRLRCLPLPSVSVRPFLSNSYTDEFKTGGQVTFLRLRTERRLLITLLMTQLSKI